MEDRQLNPPGQLQSYALEDLAHEDLEFLSMLNPGHGQQAGTQGVPPSLSASSSSMSIVPASSATWDPPPSLAPPPTQQHGQYAAPGPPTMGILPQGDGGFGAYQQQQQQQGPPLPTQQHPSYMSYAPPDPGAHQGMAPSMATAEQQQQQAAYGVRWGPYSDQASQQHYGSESVAPYPQQHSTQQLYGQQQLQVQQQQQQPHQQQMYDSPQFPTHQPLQPQQQPYAQQPMFSGPSYADPSHQPSPLRSLGGSGSLIPGPRPTMGSVGAHVHPSFGPSYQLQPSMHSSGPSVAPRPSSSVINSVDPFYSYAYRGQRDSSPTFVRSGTGMSSSARSPMLTQHPHIRAQRQQTFPVPHHQQQHPQQQPPFQRQVSAGGVAPQVAGGGGGIGRGGAGGGVGFMPSRTVGSLPPRAQFHQLLPMGVAPGPDTLSRTFDASMYGSASTRGGPSSMGMYGLQQQQPQQQLPQQPQLQHHPPQQSSPSFHQHQQQPQPPQQQQQQRESPLQLPRLAGSFVTRPGTPTAPDEPMRMTARRSSGSPYAGSPGEQPWMVGGGASASAGGGGGSPVPMALTRGESSTVGSRGGGDHESVGSQSPAPSIENPPQQEQQGLASQVASAAMDTSFQERPPNPCNGVEGPMAGGDTPQLPIPSGPPVSCWNVISYILGQGGFEANPPLAMERAGYRVTWNYPLVANRAAGNLKLARRTNETWRTAVHRYPHAVAILAVHSDTQPTLDTDRAIIATTQSQAFADEVMGPLGEMPTTQGVLPAVIGCRVEVLQAAFEEVVAVLRHVVSQLPPEQRRRRSLQEQQQQDPSASTSSTSAKLWVSGMVMDCTPLRVHVYGEPTWGRVRLCGHDPPTIDFVRTIAQVHDPRIPHQSRHTATSFVLSLHTTAVSHSDASSTSITVDHRQADQSVILQGSLAGTYTDAARIAHRTWLLSRLELQLRYGPDPSNRIAASHAYDQALHTAFVMSAKGGDEGGGVAAAGAQGTSLAAYVSIVFAANGWTLPDHVFILGDVLLDQSLAPVSDLTGRLHTLVSHLRSSSATTTSSTTAAVAADTHLRTDPQAVIMTTPTTSASEGTHVCTVIIPSANVFKRRVVESDGRMVALPSDAQRWLHVVAVDTTLSCVWVLRDRGQGAAESPPTFRYNHHAYKHVDETIEDLDCIPVSSEGPLIGFTRMAGLCTELHGVGVAVATGFEAHRRRGLVLQEVHTALLRNPKQWDLDIVGLQDQANVQTMSHSALAVLSWAIQSTPLGAHTPVTSLGDMYLKEVTKFMSQWPEPTVDVSSRFTAVFHLPGYEHVKGMTVGALAAAANLALGLCVPLGYHWPKYAWSGKVLADGRIVRQSDATALTPDHIRHMMVVRGYKRIILGGWTMADVHALLSLTNGQWLDQRLLAPVTHVRDIVPLLAFVYRMSVYQGGDGCAQWNVYGVGGMSGVQRITHDMHDHADRVLLRGRTSSQSGRGKENGGKEGIGEAVNGCGADAPSQGAAVPDSTRLADARMVGMKWRASEPRRPAGRRYGGSLSYALGSAPPIPPQAPAQVPPSSSALPAPPLPSSSTRPPPSTAPPASSLPRASLSRSTSSPPAPLGYFLDPAVPPSVRIMEPASRVTGSSPPQPRLRLKCPPPQAPPREQHYQQYSQKQQQQQQQLYHEHQQQQQQQQQQHVHHHFHFHFHQPPLSPVAPPPSPYIPPPAASTFSPPSAVIGAACPPPQYPAHSTAWSSGALPHHDSTISPAQSASSKSRYYQQDMQVAASGSWHSAHERYPSYDQTSHYGPPYHGPDVKYDVETKVEEVVGRRSKRGDMGGSGSSDGSGDADDDDDDSDGSEDEDDVDEDEVLSMWDRDPRDVILALGMARLTKDARAQPRNKTGARGRDTKRLEKVEDIMKMRVVSFSHITRPDDPDIDYTKHVPHKFDGRRSIGPVRGVMPPGAKIRFVLVDYWRFNMEYARGPYRIIVEKLLPALRSAGMLADRCECYLPVLSVDDGSVPRPKGAVVLQRAKHNPLFFATSQCYRHKVPPYLKKTEPFIKYYP